MIKLVRLRIPSWHRVFPFSCWLLEGPRKIQAEDGRIKISIFFRENESILERLLLGAVPDKEFLHKKINNREVCVGYDSTAQKHDAFS